MTEKGHTQTSSLQNIARIWTILTAFFLMLFENVKAFSTSRVCKTAAQSCHSCLAQTSSRIIHSCSFSKLRLDGTSLKMGLKRVSSRGKELSTGLSSRLGTQSTASQGRWSFPSMENLSAFNNLHSSLNTQLRVFGSWHQEVDFRAASPVYNDLDALDGYSYAASTDFIPSLSDWVVEEYAETADKPATESRRFRPFRMVRRVANWAFGFGLHEVEKTSF